MRNLKVLGLALAAMFALTAVVASAAMAATESFHSEVTPAITQGSQTETHKFTTTQGNVTCETATFEGTVTTSPTSETTVHPAYSGCHLTNLEFISATVTTTGCNYRFYNVNSKSGPTDIVCETGKSITVATIGCTIKVPGQTGLSSVSYANEGSGSTESVKVTANVSGISYTTSGGICGTHSETNGTYKGPTLVKGFQDNSGTKGTQKGISVS